MAVIYNAVLYDDVLRRNSSAAAVFVFTGLHADGIIAYVEAATIDNHVFATFYVNAIAILRIPRIAYFQLAQYYVLAHEGVDIPCRGVFKANAFKQYVFTADEIQHHRTEEAADCFPFFLRCVLVQHGYVLIWAKIRCTQCCRVRPPRIFLAIYYTRFTFLFPLRNCHFGALERTPAIAVAIKYAMTHDGNVFCIDS